MTYRPDIDGLRAVAILLVVIFHFDVFGAGAAGFIGVDVFFVISGFLITGIVVQDLAAGRFHFGHFLYRRVRRLYPAMLTTLVIYVIAAYWFFLPDLFRELSVETALSLLYVANIYFWRSVNYFGLQADNVPLLHMWSLAVEEQFYLIFPVFFLLVHKIWPRGLLPAVALTGTASFALGLFASSWKPEAAFYLLPTRAWELLLGALLALGVRRYPPEGAWLWLAGPLGFALIGWAVFTYTPVTLVPGWFALLPTLGASALILGGFEARAPTTRLLSTPPMVWIGLISYPLYLVHWPVLIFLRNLVPDSSLEWRLSALGLSVMLAWAIYRLIEHPIRTRSILAHPVTYSATAGGLTLGLLVVSVVSIHKDGLPERFSPEVQRLLAYASDRPEGFHHCQFTPEVQTLNTLCRLGVEGHAPSVLVIGDSHAETLAGAVDLWLDDTGRTAAFMFAHACLPVLNVGPSRCSDFVAQTLSAALDDPGINEVILISSWRFFEGPGLVIDGRWLEHPDTYSVFSNRLAFTVQNMVTDGKVVTLIEPLFSAPVSVPQGLAQKLAFGWNQPINTDLDEHRAVFSELYAAFDRAEAAGARRISLIDELCADGICRSAWQGRPVFTDNSHLAFGMTPYIAQVLREKLGTTQGP
jgi:peptidoglycan/LPS O-acetylase OafA/YrhL